MDARTVHELGQGRADATEALVTAVDFPTRTVTVNANGITRAAPWAGPAPWIGDRVRLVQAGVGNVFAVLIEGAPMGTVITTSGGVATVTGDDSVQYKYPHLGDAPSNGARVRLDHAGHCVAAGSYEVDGESGDGSGGGTPPPTGLRSAWFSPSWSAGWRLGSYATNQVETSYNRVAGWGFGTTVADTIPDAAAIRKAELHLIINWDRSGSNDPVNAGVHGYGDQPNVLTTGDISGSVMIGRGVTIVDVRGVADLFKTGAARGFGIRPDSSYWLQYGAAPNSGRLYMEWE